MFLRSKNRNGSDLFSSKIEETYEATFVLILEALARAFDDESWNLLFSPGA